MNKKVKSYDGHWVEITFPANSKLISDEESAKCIQALREKWNPFSKEVAINEH